LGDADEIVQYLCGRLGKGWTLPPPLAEEEDPQSISKVQRGLTGPSKVAGAAVGEPPSLKNKSSARSISSGGASGSTSSSATNKAKGKAEDKIQGATAEPTRIGASHVWTFAGAEPGTLLTPRRNIGGNDKKTSDTTQDTSQRNSTSGPLMDDDDTLDEPLTPLTVPVTDTPEERETKRMRVM